MTLPMFRVALGACTLAMTTVAHAATPITLPLGDIGVQLMPPVDLPVPPPPPVARPDVSQFRLILKRQPRGCDQERRPAFDHRRHVWEPMPASSPTVTKPVMFRWG